MLTYFYKLIMKITVLEPKGYCAGVKNAIALAEQTKNKYSDREVFVYGNLVHNQVVIDHLTSLGIKTITYNDMLNDFVNLVPNNSVVIFTAHGHNVHLNKIAEDKGCIVIDAICPKVKHNLDLISNELKNHKKVVYIGQEKHPETIGALSLSNDVILYSIDKPNNYLKSTNDDLLVINQTTLNISEITNHYDFIKSFIPNARFQDEICAATRFRQEAIRNLDLDVDLVLVLGDKSSSNTNKLIDISLKYNSNIPCFLISSLNDISKDLVCNKKHIVISSGSSTPPDFVDNVCSLIKSY